MRTMWLVAVMAVLGACSGDPAQSDSGGGSGAGGGGGGGAGGAAQSSSGANSSGANQGGTSAGGGASGSSQQAGSGGTGSAGAAGGSSGGSGGSAAGAAGSAGTPMIPDDAGSGACHDYTPCGGDVVGNWNIDICSDPPLHGLKALCPAATETSDITGTAQIRADGTITTTLSLRFETVVPASCVSELGACGVVGQGINLLEDCTPGQDGSCVCSSTNEPEPSEATYTTTPEGLLTIVRNGEPSYTYYCRQNEEFWARGVDESTGRVSVLHFTKQ